MLLRLKIASNSYLDLIPLFYLKGSYLGERSLVNGRFASGANSYSRLYLLSINIAQNTEKSHSLCIGGGRHSLSGIIIKLQSL